MRPSLVMLLVWIVLGGEATESVRADPPAEVVDAAPDEMLRYSYASVLMGVRMEVVLYAPDEATARAAAKSAFDRIAEIEQVASTYREESELSRLQRRASEQPVSVSQDLFDLLAMSTRLHERTDGAFDCSVYRLVQLWRGIAKAGELPPESEIEETRRSSRSEDIRLDSEHRTVLFTRPVAITLDGVAKGFAGDEALKVI